MSKSRFHINLERTFQWTKLFMNLMYQSIPSMTIPLAKPLAYILMGEFPTPWTKKFKTPTPWIFKIKLKTPHLGHFPEIITRKHEKMRNK